MLTLTLALVLTQPAVVRGDALRTRQYQTSATVALFVDSTGNDGNTCTGTGTAACATVTGALSKLPRFLRNNVTIDVANGAYTDAFNVQDFVSNNDSTLTIRGTMVNSTLATGTATGTLTAVNTNTSVAIGTLLDSAQTWTANDLRGKYFVFTSGPASGSMIPIVSNAADFVTLSTGGISTPVAGNTYAIQEPGAVFTTSSLMNIRNINSRSLVPTVAIERVTLNRPGGSTLAVSGAVSLRMTNVRVLTGAFSAVSAASMKSGVLQCLNLFAESSGTAATFSANTGAEAEGPPFVQLGTSGNGYVRNTSTGAAVSLTGVRTGSFSGVYESATLTGSVVTTSPQGSTSAQSANTYVTCTAGASSNVGISFGQSPSSTSGTWTAANYTFNGNVGITGCSTGVNILMPNARVSMRAPHFTSVTTAVSLSGGATFDLSSSTPGFTGVTNEFSIDGTVVPLSMLTGLQAPQFIRSPRGSTLIR